MEVSVECIIRFHYHINCIGGYMAGQLGLKLGRWLYQKGSIDEDQIDVVRYAFEILCSELTSFITIVLYGLLTKQIFETALYLIFFHILRYFFHGYHAKTIPRCFALTITSYLLTMIVYSYITDLLLIIFVSISLLLQLEYCHKKCLVKPIIVSLTILFIIIAISIMFSIHNILLLFSVVDLIVSVSLIPERRKYREE